MLYVAVRYVSIRPVVMSMKEELFLILVFVLFNDTYTILFPSYSPNQPPF